MAVSEAASADTEERAVRPFLEGVARAPLGERIRAEIARREPRPVARRTLEFLVTAAIEPSAGEPGYRVVDRHGRPRLRPEGDPRSGEPLGLDDLLDEIAGRHPDLFLPRSEPEPGPEPVRESSLAVGASEMRAATARFVETQSERARALAERSSEQGQHIARRAADALAAGRTRLAARAAAWRERRAAAPDAPPIPPGASPGRSAGPSWDGGGVAEAVRHPWIAGGAGAVLAMVLAAGLVVGLRSTGERSGTDPGRTAETPAPQAAREAAEPPPESESPAVTPEPPRPAANAVTGQVQVIDTATLRLNGKLVRLFGVEWVRGGQADELTRYINNRPVTCQPVPGSENQICQIEGRDLSEVVLFNGGGRASSEATPELVAAEDHARSERLGVWKR